MMASPVDGPEGTTLSVATDPTKAVLSGVQDGGSKRRRKPYRPGM